MEIVEFGALTDAYRAQLEGDEDDPFDAAGSPLRWRSKDRHVALRDAGGRLVASVGLLTTEIRVHADEVVPIAGVDANEIVPIVGIGGVIVAAHHRGRGLAREVLTAALGRAETLGPPLALLFCHRDRVGLYERFGFRVAAGPVLVGQPGGTVEMPHVTMWRALRPGAALRDGRVTLLGEPF
jgi:predicted GNAT family N-acyltransferase